MYSHYIVPELGPETKFQYASKKAVSEYKEAKEVRMTRFILLHLRLLGVCDSSEVFGKDL